MKNRNHLLFPVLFLLTGHFASSQNNIDVLHYKYTIELNDDNDTIRGTAEITFIARKGDSKVEFDLTGVIDNKKGMTVSSATMPYGIPYNYINPNITSHFNNKLSINAWKTLEKDDTLTAVIEYKGIPTDGLIISKNKFGHRTFFADNWPNRGHNWLPCHDDPADKASVEFIVTAPQHYQVVANGIQIEETDLGNAKKLTHWKEDVPISTKVMVIGVADFAVNLSGFVEGCIPVYSWVYPEERENGFYDYAQAKDILPFYIKNVGPYGYKKLANVQSKTTFGGLENANTIFYSERSINGKRRSEGLLAHEIAHQWFGNMATEKSFAHLWLSEGFATYMTICYFENKYGVDTALKMLVQDRQQVINHSKTSDHSVVDNSPDYMSLLNPNSYEKGGWVLHMLRRQLGDSVFWKSIRRYYATYAGKTADTDDLRKIFEAVSGKDLKQFFQQWLFTPGQPKLEVSWKYLSKEKKLAVTVAQQQKGAAFSFPLEISIVDVGGKKMIQKCNISKATEIFTFPIKDWPANIQLDPNTSLLFEGSISEVKQ